MRKCIIFGHSHIYALMWAAALSESIAQRQKDVTFEFLPIAPTRWTYPLVRIDNGRTAPNDYVMQLLLLAGGLDQDSCLFAIFGGNDHNILGLLQEDPPFEVVDPERLDLTLRNGTRIVPYHQLQNYFFERLRDGFDFLNALKMETKNSITQLETPPPIPSTEHIKLHLEPYFRNQTLEPVISSAAIRMKLWSCMTSVVRNNCKKLDIAYLSGPEDALDTEGFLIGKAWADATHASVWYGEKYLEKIHHLVTAAP